jgi:hypothetical protein
MAVTAGLDPDRDNVPRPRLDRVQIVEVLRSPVRPSLNKMEQVFVGKPQAIPFRARCDVRLAPDDIVAQDPAAVLQGNGEPRGE